VLIFLAIMGLMLYFYGASHVRRGQKERDRRSSQENSFIAAAKESMAGKYVIGAGVVLFVAVSLLVFFTGPGWLAGDNKAPDDMQTSARCSGDYSWCTACLPSTWLMIAFAGGISLAVVIAGSVLVGVGEKKKVGARQFE
jgi:hypothetical protein